VSGGCAGDKLLDGGLCRETKFPCDCVTSRGGDIGSLLIFTDSGDVLGGGVLLLTDKCGKPALDDADVGLPWFSPPANEFCVDQVCIKPGELKPTKFKSEFS